MTEWERQRDLSDELVDDYFVELWGELYSAVMFEWSKDDYGRYIQAKDHALAGNGHFDWWGTPLSVDASSLLPAAARSTYDRVRELRGSFRDACAPSLHVTEGYCFCEWHFDIIADVMGYWLEAIDVMFDIRRSVLRIAHYPPASRMSSWVPTVESGITVAEPFARLKRLGIALNSVHWSRNPNFPDDVRATIFRASIGDFVAGAKHLLTEAAEDYWEVVRNALAHLLELDTRHRKIDFPPDYPSAVYQRSARDDTPWRGEWTLAKARGDMGGRDVPSDIPLRSLSWYTGKSQSYVDRWSVVLHDLIHYYMAFIVQAQLPRDQHDLTSLHLSWSGWSPYSMGYLSCCHRPFPVDD